MSRNLLRIITNKIRWVGLPMRSIHSVITYPKFSSVQKDNPLLGSKEFQNIKELNSIIDDLKPEEYMKLKSVDRTNCLNFLVKHLVKCPDFQKMTCIQINKSSTEIIKFIRKGYEPKSEDTFASIEINSFIAELSRKIDNRLEFIAHSATFTMLVSILGISLAVLIKL